MICSHILELMQIFILITHPQFKLWAAVLSSQPINLLEIGVLLV